MSQERSLEAESFNELSDRLLGVGHSVADSSLIFVDLMVIATLECLISPEVNLIIIVLDELETEGLVPPLREDIDTHNSILSTMITAESSVPWSSEKFDAMTVVYLALGQSGCFTCFIQSTPKSFSIITCLAKVVKVQSCT